jgi:hypothetical protein
VADITRSPGSGRIFIPPAALEAGARTLCNEQRLFWHGLSTQAQDIIRGEARAACLAMLTAWPGMSQLAENDSASIREMAALILPLPQEASDE